MPQNYSCDHEACINKMLIASEMLSFCEILSQIHKHMILIMLIIMMIDEDAHRCWSFNWPSMLLSSERKKLLMSYPKKQEKTVLENALIMLIEEIYEATN